MLKKDYLNFVEEFSPIATLLAVSTLLFIVFGQGATVGNYLSLFVMGLMSMPTISNKKSYMS